jgi:transposase-like protein
MNTFRYDKEQRQAWVLDKLNGTKSVKRICREANISRATLYNWIEEFPEYKSAALEVKAAEEAALPFDPLSLPEISNKSSTAGRYDMLLKVLTQADPTGAVKKKLVQLLVKRFTLSIAAACELVALDEAAYGYKPRKPEAEDRLVYEEISRILEEDKTRTFEQCCTLLQAAHPGWPRKQIKRLWGEKKLYLQRARTRRKSTTVVRTVRPRLLRPGASWRPGFIALPGAAPSWLLFITDEQDNMPINALQGNGTAPTVEEVIGLFTTAASENGQPRKIILAGKPPFNMRELTVWVWEQKIALQSLSMAKPENEEACLQQEANMRAAFENYSLTAADGQRPAGLVDSWLQTYVPTVENP